MPLFLVRRARRWDGGALSGGSQKHGQFRGEGLSFTPAAHPFDIWVYFQSNLYTGAGAMI